MSATAAGPAPASPATETPIQSQPAHRETTSIDDHSLPKSVIVRLAKSVLPDNTMIQKDAVTALIKSATVFINHVSAIANDVTREKGKKTINNDEVLEALDIAEFDMMIPQLKQHIEQFEITRKEKRKKAEQDEDGRKKRKIEEDKAEDSMADINGDEEDTEMGRGSDDEETIDERDEQDDENEDDENAEGELDDEEDEIDQEDRRSGLAVDVEEHNGLSEGDDEEETDEALVEDSD